MELAKIEQLLNTYFEGNTSLREEEELRAIFQEEDLPQHLAVYKPMFAGYAQAKQEVSKRKFEIPSKRNNRYWKYGIAASLLLSIGVGTYFFTQPSLSAEEAAALAAFEKTKETMFMLSQNLNQVTESMLHLNEFANGSSKMSLLNEFTESKNLILK